MRISSKILILVSMPLAFQLGMSVFLFDQVKQTQIRIEQETERKRLVAALDKVHHLHLRSLAAAAFYSINRNEEVGKRHLSLLKELTAECKELAKQTSTNTELCELTKNLRQSISTVVKYELLMRKMSLMSDAPQLGQSQKAREAIKDSMHQIEDFQKKLIPPIDDLQALQNEARQQFIELAALLVVIVGLTGGLLVWSQKNILEVLEQLLNQIAKFKKGESLTPTLSAGNEMAELEVVICDSANRIETLERLRRELSSIVSHDVRAPMTSIEGVVTLLESGAFGELKQEQEVLVAKQKTISGDLLNVLNNILDLDKLRSGKWNVSVSPVTTNEICNKIRAEIFATCGERQVSVECVDGTLLCDVDALSRAIVALVSAYGSEGTEVTLRCGEAIECTVSAEATQDESRPLRNGDRHKEQIARGLAELFCDVQNLQIAGNDTDRSIKFTISPRATVALSASESQVSPKSESFSKVGRRLQALISGPMAVSATAVILYGVLFSQFANDVGRELVSREIVHRATSISSGITQLMLLSIRRTPDEIAKEEVAARTRAKAKLDADVQALRVLESQARLSMPHELELVQKKVDDVKRLSDKLSEGPVTDLPETLKEVSGKDGTLFSIAFSKAGSLLSEREAKSTTTKALSDLRTNVLNMLIGASIASVLLTIYSARQIVLEFLARLNNVAGNARRLANREVLREPDKGSDEIADLDAFFYKVATQIDQLESERKHLSGLLREQLKTPLLKLRDGFRSIINEPSSLNDKGQNRIQRVLVEINRLSDLVDDLLILDSLDKGGELTSSVTVTEVAVGEIVEPSIDAVTPQAELKGIIIALTGDTTLKVTADARASIRVVVNLLSNALKFSPDKSTVTVSVESADNEQVRISVMDKGRGIPDLEKHKIFSRFDQVARDDKSKGSGLGLFISQKLAEAQGGSLTFISQEGEGTTFTLTLPAANLYLASSGVPQDQSGA